MIHSIKVQTAMRAYNKPVHAIERSKPVINSGMDTQAQNKNSHSSSDPRKSFSRILKEEMQKNS